MIFNSPRLYVRSFTEADAENFYALNGNEEIMRYIRAAKSREETDAFLKEVIENERNGTAFRWALIRKEGDLFVGSFAIIPLIGTGKMQLGYALLKDFWGVGYATEITLAGIQYALGTLQLDSISAVTQVPNITSQKVLLKCGFKQLENYFEEEKELCLFEITNSPHDRK